MTASRFKSARARNVTLTVAAVGSLHFFVASLLWSCLILCVGKPGLWHFGPILWGTGSSFVLLACFALASVAALRRRRIAASVLVSGLVLGAAVFVYDATAQGWVVRAENYLEGRTTYLYPTWWWYNWRGAKPMQA